MGNPKEIGEKLGSLVKTQAAGLTLDLLLGDYRGAMGRIKEIPTNIKSTFNELNSQAVHQYEATLVINQKGRRSLQFADYQDLRDFDLKFYLYHNPQMRRFLFGPLISSLIDPLFKDDRGGRDKARSQHAYNQDLVEVIFSLEDGKTMFVALPHGKDPQEGWAMAKITKKGNKALIQTHLSPSISKKELERTLEALRARTNGQKITFGNNNSPFSTAVITNEPSFDFVQKPDDFRNWVSGVLGPNIWQRPIPTCQNCQVNSQPRTIENSTLTHAQIERTREPVSLIQGVYPAGPEPLLRLPVSMFRNIRTEVNPTPESTPSSVVLSLANIYTKPKIELFQEANQETREKQAKVELPINPVKVGVTVQPQDLSLREERAWQLKPATKPSQTEQAPMFQTCPPLALPLGDGRWVIEENLDTHLNQANQETDVGIQTTTVVRIDTSDEVKRKTDGIRHGSEPGEKVIFASRERQKDKPVTPPLIEIPIIEIPTDTLMIYIIKAKLEPVGEEQTNMVENVVETREESQEEPEKIVKQASQEREDEEVKEEAEPTEQKEPRIFLVKNFVVNYSDVSIHRSSKPASEIGELEVKKLEILPGGRQVRKLVWMVSSAQNEASLVLLEFELPKDPNQRLYAFLHFLRQLTRKTLGEDMIWTRQVMVIDNDEPAPVDLLEEIGYYLELLNRRTYAQVFAFAD